MQISEIILTITHLFGGLALFIFGMKIMSDGLQTIAGDKLKNILQLLTKKQIFGLVIGTLISFLIHSSATTTMISSFINAGLLGLGQSMGLIFGANLGTTLSMQIISLDFGKYCYLILAIGFFIYLAAKNIIVKNIGFVLLGFGLLFLGMTIMKHSIVPFHEAGYFENLILLTNASTISGLFWGLLVSTFATAIMQSSGAMIGILFALSMANVFTSFNQVFPLILGAHIGTCVTPILGSIGANADAKRSALAHVLFNVFGAMLAIIMFKFYAWIIPKTSANISRQIANAHTMIQLINCIIFLPFSFLFTKFIRKITAFMGVVRIRKSYLNNDHLETPEQALYSALKEIQRMFAITQEMLRSCMEGILKVNDRYFITVEKNEAVLNTLKSSINQYLSIIAEQNLTRRQTRLVQFNMNATSDVERIGDHIEALTKLIRQKQKRKVWFSKQQMKDILKLYKVNQKILSGTIESLDLKNFQNEDMLQKIIENKENYKKLSSEVKERLNEVIDSGVDDPMTSIYYLKIISVFDKIVKHGETVLIEEMNPKIFIRKEKFHRKTRSAALRAAIREKFKEEDIQEMLGDY